MSAALGAPRAAAEVLAEQRVARGCSPGRAEAGQRFRQRRPGGQWQRGLLAEAGRQLLQTLDDYLGARALPRHTRGQLRDQLRGLRRRLFRYSARVSGLAKPAVSQQPINPLNNLPSIICTFSVSA